MAPNGASGLPLHLPLGRAGLSALMRLSAGCADVRVGVIDGPVQTELAEFSEVRFRSAGQQAAVFSPNDPASVHATLVTSLLAARRDGEPSGICPGCSFILHPIFEPGTMPRATPAQLARAIQATVNAGARVINMSLALLPGTTQGLEMLVELLDAAWRRGVVIVAAAGNQARIGHSLVAGHPAVIPVTASDVRGGPTAETNLGRSIGQRGVSAPGEYIVGLRPDGTRAVFGGTSAAAPFVTGAIALLYSLLPDLDRERLMWSLTRARRGRSGLVPAPLDGWTAYQMLTGERMHAA